MAHLHVHFHKVFVAQALPHGVSVSCIGGDEAGYGNHACIYEELGHLPHTPYVLCTVLSAEAQIIVEPMPGRIAGSVSG